MTSLPETLSECIEGPLVSVIIPTYDDAEYLPDALASVAAQTYTSLEVIVVDSSGDAETIIEDLEWVEYHEQEPRGPAAARNLGIEHAEGDYVAFLDADDRWLPKKLERQVAALEQKDVSLVYHDQYVEDIS